MHLDESESRGYLLKSADSFKQASVEMAKQISTAPIWGKVKSRIICGAGCYGCCHQLVSTFPLEGIAVANYLLLFNNEDLLTAVKRLDEAFVVCWDPNEDPSYYFDRAIPCVFLSDTCCSIYDCRPAACRLHLMGAAYDVEAAVAAKGCYPKESGGGVPRHLMLANAHKQHLAQFHMKLLGKEGLGRLVTPLPMSVLLGLEILTHGTERHEVVFEYTETVAESIAWGEIYTKNAEEVTAADEKENHDVEVLRTFKIIEDAPSTLKSSDS